jgi:hypothetical protein
MGVKKSRNGFGQKAIQAFRNSFDEFLFLNSFQVKGNDSGDEMRSGRDYNSFWPVTMPVTRLQVNVLKGEKK